MINEGLKLSGDLKIDVVDENGNLKDSRDLKNLVVTAGLNFIAGRIIGTTPAVMTHIGIGDGGGTAAAAAQTNLQGTNKLRKAFTTAASRTNNVVTYICLFGTADNITGGAITEAAIFNNGTDAAGDMLCRTVFPVVNKGANDTMTITWTITLNAA